MRALMIPGILAVLVLSACGGGDGGGGSYNLKPLGETPISGVGAGTNFGFDLGLVVNDRYYLTDRNNAAVDVFSTANSGLLAQVRGTGSNAFAGAVLSSSGAANNALSGPNGVNAVGGSIYAGDVNSVKVIDATTLQVTKTIVVGTGGTRADEGCVDSVHSLYMISTPEANPPFSTFINTTTQAVVATVTYTDASGKPSAGIEQCRYDPGTDAFYVNNDGTTANPHGELVVLPGASIRGIAAKASVNYTTLAGVQRYSEGNCDPTGLALGPNNDIAVGCRESTTNTPLLVQIMDRTNGSLLASVNAGGGDQIEYDASTNRYYNAGSRWTASGLAATNGACSTAAPCSPVLSVIDAGTRTLVAQLPTGNNAHSVAVDPITGKAFLPVSSASSPAGGCAFCDPAMPAGLLTFAIR